jgi:hypothetical protein
VYNVTQRCGVSQIECRHWFAGTRRLRAWVDLGGLPRSFPKAVLGFANRYDTLHARLEFNSFLNWCDGIQQVHESIQLGDAIIAGDWRRIPKALEPFLAAPHLANAPEIRLIHQKQKGGETISRDELAHAALTQLYKRVAPLERFGGTVGAWNADSGKVELRLKCNELIDFMFLQLGRTLLGDRRVRQGMSWAPPTKAGEKFARCFTRRNVAHSTNRRGDESNGRAVRAAEADGGAHARFAHA